MSQQPILDIFRRFTTPLELVSTEARGTPQHERIYMRANQRVALRDYLLLVGVRLLDGTAYPSPHHVLWLGTDTLEAGTWLIVYTGIGSPLVTYIQGTGEPARVLYWGKSITLFNDPRVIPILVRFDTQTAQIENRPGT